MARIDNREMALVFYEIADLIRIKGGNPHRARAFQRAGRIIENLAEPVANLIPFGGLRKIPGVGEGTLHRVKQILRSGTCDELRRLHRDLPRGLPELLEVRGVGARRAFMLYQHLRVGSIAELEWACKAGRVAPLPRFGSKVEQQLLEGIAAYRRRVGRLPYDQSLRSGMAIVESMRELPAVARAELCGSTRRGKATIGDLDILVAAHAADFAAIAARFVTLPQAGEVLVYGEGRCSIRTRIRQQVDLRLVPPESFGAGLHYFTGSNLHNIHIRARGNRRKLKISEHGVFTRGDERRLLTGEHEQEIFHAVGLPWIPPELRENLGEIEAAARGRLPRLVQGRDLRGDLHLHTAASGGVGTVQQMARRARALGLAYLAITEHAGSAKGLDARQLARHVERVRRIGARCPGIEVLAGVEVEIRRDGTLALDRTLLASLDWVIAAIHQDLELDEATQTARLIGAIESGVVDCIGHPTGRLLGERVGYRIDLDRVLAAARRGEVAIECNGSPRRMDLDDLGCRAAASHRVPVVISSDAHAVAEVGRWAFALTQARRGWLRPAQVLNTRPWAEIAERRRRRLSRAGLIAAASGHGHDPERLARAIAAGLDEPLRARLEIYLQGGDPEVEAALRLLGAANPLQRAFDLLHQGAGSAAD